MKKYGFTMVEIIVCIALIAIIGTASFFGIRLVSKNITIEKLDQIKDKILLATEIYIETNKETYNKLYNEKNGVLIPLNVLVNEGLLDITGTKLDDEELKNNYVISMLTNDPPTGGCKNIKTVTSWNESSNEPLFICVDENGKSNLATIDPAKYGNMMTISTEPYYFKGVDPDNWVSLGNETTKMARIYKIERDDSIVLYYNYNDNDIKTKLSLNENNTKLHNTNYYITTSRTDICNTINGCIYIDAAREDTRVIIESGTVFELESGGNSISTGLNLSDITFMDYDGDNNVYNRLYFLKPCWKISGGTGSKETPFVLDSSKCN